MKKLTYILTFTLLIAWQSVLFAGNNSAVGSVSNATETVKIQVYPNPTTTGYINIKAESQISELVVLNIVGQPVLKQNVNQEETFRLNVGELNSGLYILKTILADKKESIQRIVIK